MKHNTHCVSLSDDRLTCVLCKAAQHHLFGNSITFSAAAAGTGCIGARMALCACIGEGLSLPDSDSRRVGDTAVSTTSEPRHVTTTH